MQLSLIMIDLFDWEGLVGPTHIVASNYDFIPVYIGYPLSKGEIDLEVLSGGGLGVYIRSEDYRKIDHYKIYVFIHDPNCEECRQEILEYLKKDKRFSEYVNFEDSTSKTRQHVHIEISKDDMVYLNVKELVRSV